MKQNTILAILLIVLGIAAFTYQGITFKTREKAVDLGSIQVTTEKTKNIPIPPILGALALGAGIILLLRDTKGIAKN